MKQIEYINLEKFFKLFKERVAPHFTQHAYPQLLNSRHHGPLISVACKTYRVSLDRGDFDALGTVYPDSIALEKAKEIAAIYNLSVKWGEGEKGWGYLYFKSK